MMTPAETLRPPNLERSGRLIALPENRSATRAVRRLAARIAAFRPTDLQYVHGPAGAGKSLLVAALQRHVTCRRPDISVPIVPARDLGQSLIQGDSAVREFRACDLLVVEDFQYVQASAAAALCGLIDCRRARCRAVVVTASCGPARLSLLPARLRDRLACGLVVQIDAPGLESRKELARTFCARCGVSVGDDVIEWLARRSGSARSIIGDVARLKELSRSIPLPLDLATVMAGLHIQGDDHRPTVEQVVARVADYYDVRPKQLTGSNRQNGVCWARQVAMYLVRQACELPLARVGTFFAGRDHTTVLHACRKVEEVIATDPAFAGELRELTALIG
jgi:chromosomal replication initiator protein